MKSDYRKVVFLSYWCG